MLYRARLDCPNDLTTNGEKNLQRWVAGLSAGGTKLHVIDVGANVGKWSESMISAVRQADRLDDLRLDVFEPSTHTFTLLSQRVTSLAGEPVSNGPKRPDGIVDLVRHWAWRR